MRVPKTANLALKVSYAAVTDPTLLSAYGPDFFAYLDFSKVETDDRVFAVISKLTNLQALNLDGADLSNQGLKDLSNLRQLQYLYLSRSGITDRTLEWLPTGSLEQLISNQTKISDRGLKSIQKCRDLRKLNLSDCHITDAGLPSIATLTELEELDLSNTKITAKGLLQLIGLKKLLSLSVRNTLITAEDLPVVKQLCQKMPSLNSIEIGGKSFTIPVVAHWQQSIPHVALHPHKNSDLKGASPVLFAPLH